MSPSVRDLELRELAPGDEPSLLELLAAAPGAPSAEEWRWAGASPAGRRAWVAADGARVAACVAAVPLRVWMAGGERTFAGCLVAARRPELVGGLGRTGAVAAVARALARAAGGPEGDWVHFGAPDARGARVADHLLDYEVVRNELLLLREPGPGPTAPPAGVETLADFDHQARWLWDRCAGEWGASTVRDADYLRWRYLERPGARCEPLGVRDGDGVLRGLAVYRAGRRAGRDLGLVLDWLVPPGEPDAAELLLAGALACARRDGAEALALCAPEWSAWFALLQERGFLVHPSGRWLRARTFHPKFGTLWLRDSWWHQLGDWLDA